MGSKKNKIDMENTDKRTIIVASKVNKSEYDKIKSLTEKCGMTISRYIREISIAYEPRHILTEKEISILEKMVIISGKFRNFASRFNDLYANIKNGDVNDEETEVKTKAIQDEGDAIMNTMNNELIEFNRYGRSKRENPQCEEGAGLCQV